ncbi:hypothetical protein DSO57_1030103 [Entomophthora muscae]|uniref:Uncharacterized protein n=1 Tax=Entomophthora muscae TaxID=34485 RepID=A0ACC2SQ58_9FUNG|nr:hypothetical protein DSO57_1030103 [Entomophthora muscae]
MLEFILHVVMVLGLVCNIVALGVILRQDVRKPDLSLAMIMALSDMFLVTFKLVDSLCSFMLGEDSNALVNDQWKGVITTFLLQLSAVSVGGLAFLRFCIIFLRCKISMVLWWSIFVSLQLLILGLLIVVGVEGQYKSLQLMSLSYPGINSGMWVVELCRNHLLASFIWPLVAVNISYPCIARLYESNLRIFHIDKSIYKHTCFLYLKILVFTFVYNLVMLPTFYVLLMETITGQLQSPTMESIAAVTLFSMTFFNPLVLLLLHQETFRELRELGFRLKYRFLALGPNGGLVAV